MTSKKEGRVVKSNGEKKNGRLSQTKNTSANNHGTPNQYLSNVSNIEEQ